MVSESSALAKNAGNMKQTYDEEVDADLLEEYDFLAASEINTPRGANSCFWTPTWAKRLPIRPTLTKPSHLERQVLFFVR